MNIEGAVALVSGANRGLGRCFVHTLLARGAARIYAGARDPGALPFDDPRVVALPLDITDARQVREAAARAQDLTLLINNAGVNHLERLLEAHHADSARAEMEVNYFGTLAMCRAFAPILAANSRLDSSTANGQEDTAGSAIINMLSVLARVALPAMGSLCASKAAALRMTEALRAELAGRGVRVLGVLPGAIDTDMSRDFPPPKLAVTEVAEAALDALGAQADEVYVGEMAMSVAAGLAADRFALQRRLAGFL